MIVDCISDLHGSFVDLPSGDLLIIAGDCTALDKITQWNDFFAWLKKQDYKKKILIAGNHDNFLYTAFPKTLKEAEECKQGQYTGDFSVFMESYDPDVYYLCDSGIEYEGIKMWGSPWTASFEGMNPCCMAFTKKSDKLLASAWKNIPKDTQILITHSPPYGILDDAIRPFTGCIERTGSESLLKRVKNHMPNLKLHVFGHIHEGFGQKKEGEVTFVNASNMTRMYTPQNRYTRIIL